MAKSGSVARMEGEKNSIPLVYYRMEASCLELALEGERLCKEGDYSAGVPFFEAAMQVGTEDLLVLSAIYSQLGNAYFHLHEYAKALEFHHHDLTLTRTTGDLLGEAKASGNLGNILKVLGRFDEAVIFCQRHLDICTDVGDKMGQARALYNFGNVYHAKGKRVCSNGSEPGNFPEEVTAALKKAAEYYEKNLCILKELGDRPAQGRTYGNLGNTQYLLSNFCNAVDSHKMRLLIAKEFGDLAAERRAYCNLGNAYIFLGEFEKAAEHYKRALQLARHLRDRAVEAQACYSLGNTYTLLQDYERAIDYHLKHLIIAQDLGDKVGEGRACWSLGNAHTALGNHDQAMHFAERHLEISNETGDRCGELTARMNVSDLQTVLGLTYSTNNSVLSEKKEIDYNLHGARPRMSRRSSMENLELMTLTPEKLKCQKLGTEVLCMQSKTKSSSKFFFMNRLRGKKNSSIKVLQDTSNTLKTSQRQTAQKCVSADMLGDESFLDMLSHLQGNRMDDQRYSIQKELGCQSTATTNPSSSCSFLPKNMKKSFSESAVSQGQDAFLRVLDTAQSRRLEDQGTVGSVPVLCNFQTNQNSSRQTVLSQLMTNPDISEPDDHFFDMLMKSQGSRLNDQRCAPPLALIHGPTVPDEDFFSLIVRSQAKRMNEQRVTLPSKN
ncbi:G-protein-signaling modulator 2 isoform X2 [Pangasianodon hypophthalmus]|uniref:G-protein-signaling modulator 2 isoform X2 n=1 Tax=Pangasianodon hypophthalmus TaxID=310915 RepID=UPI00147A6229|nr:G-protein-signaling modulator 2 isoform X2 [Pangasianodon hypophthalmus]